MKLVENIKAVVEGPLLILMSGSAHQASWDYYYNLGFTHILLKPVRIESILSPLLG